MRLLAEPVTQWTGDEQRRQERQQLGIARVLERHVQQSEDDDDAHRRQRDAAMERKADGAEQAEFECAEFREVLLLPFDKKR